MPSPSSYGSTKGWQAQDRSRHLQQQEAVTFNSEVAEVVSPGSCRIGAAQSLAD